MGVFIAIFYAVVIALMVSAAKWGRKRTWFPGKWGQGVSAFLCVFFVYLVFFWRSIPSAVQLAYFCSTEAGIEVFKVADGVEGYVGGAPDPDFALGFNYVDRRHLDGSYYRSEYAQGVALHHIPEVLVREPARYERKSHIGNITPFIGRSVIEVIDRNDGSVLGRATSFNFRSENKTDWQRYTQMFWQPYGKCKTKIDVVEAVLKPVGPARCYSAGGTETKCNELRNDYAK